MNKGTAIVGFILSFIAGMMLMWGINKSGGLGGGEDITAETGGAWSHAASPISVTPEDPIWGNPNAPVTMVVFSEFECPFCSRVGNSFEQAKKEYGPDKIRIVWKSIPQPFHKNARPASVAAETVRALAGDEAFWKFHDKAFANQKALTRENFEKWAQEAGVKDMQKFKTALDKNTYAAKVDKDLALGKKLGVRGTPHTIINGVTVNGAQPYPKFKEVIDAQLKEAQAMIKAGTKPDQVYVKASQKNWKDKPKARDKKRMDPTEDKTVWKVPVGDSPAKGAKDALVTLVIFSEYQCPFCKRVEPTIDQLLKDYEGKLRVVWKDRPLPFHKRAEPTALFALEARKQKGDKGFWDAHSILFENQPKFEDENLEEYAKKLGLNWVAVKTAMEKKTHGESIQQDVALADGLKARGTPHMFINGRRLVGAQPIDKFKKLVDEELKKAEALVKKGTPKGKVYEEIMKDAKTPPPPPPPEKKDVPAPTADNAYKGGKNAKIVIQLFSDFECPFCGRVEPTLEALLEKYGDKLKVVWRHYPLPFHKNAPLASDAA
ncbi:MAG: DsbA family protein, partial [Myxococcota bacterium]